MNSSPIAVRVTPSVQQVAQVSNAMLQRCGGTPCTTCDGEEQRLSLMPQRAWQAPDFAAVPASVQETLSSSGTALDSSTRAAFEPRFGHDFSKVRIHTDARAAESAQAVSARAYTVGSDIAFAPGQYSPGTTAGQRLLAHELTHVVQQGGQSAGAQASLEVSQPGDASEREAERVAETMLSGGVSGGQRFDGVSGAVEDAEEQPDSLTQAVGVARAVAPIRVSRQAGPRVLHRTATWAAGTVSAVNNAAAQVATGGFAGQTKPMLNGTAFITTAGAQGAIKKPVLSGRSVASGGVETVISTVPQNTGSFVTTVLSAGPWSTTTTKVNADNLLGLPACAGGAGNTTLTAKGKPNDAAVAAANTAHEDHHAKDDEKIFNTIVGGWDKAMETARAAGRAFPGADPAASEAALWAAVGGTPDQVAANFWTTVDNTGNTWHTTAAGRNLNVANATSSPDCATSSFELS